MFDPSDPTGIWGFGFPLSLPPSFRRLLPHSLCHLQCPSLRLWRFLVNPGPLRPPPPTPQAGTWPGRLDGTPLVWSGQHPGALQATCSCWRTHLSVLCVGLLFSPQASSEGHLPERPPHGPTPIYSSSQHTSLAITSPVHLPRPGGPEGRGHAGLVSSVPIGCRGRGGLRGAGLQRGETGLAWPRLLCKYLPRVPLGAGLIVLNLCPRRPCLAPSTWSRGVLSSGPGETTVPQPQRAAGLSPEGHVDLCRGPAPGHLVSVL